MPSQDDRPLIGRTIAGKFAIEAHLGGGAMGSVFRAKQIALDKTIAVKVLHKELTKDPMFAGRFLREAKAASRIDHPNSMRVIDFGEEPDGLLYMAMEFLDGKDLFTVLQGEWPMSALRIVDVLSQVLAALAVAHDMGVVHRDLKPENIMVLRGTDDEGLAKDVVKVCDFGIAKITNKRTDLTQSEGPRLTTAGLVVGTPEYMSPEQGRGESLDARSDLYSVGVILFQMLTGKVPFEAETALGVVLKHVTDDPARPSTLNPAIDSRLETICLKAMRKKREARYQSAREMRADLRSVLDTSIRSMPIALPRVTLASSRPPGPIDAASGNAATEVAIDSAAVRAEAVRAAEARTRPHETETALEAVIPKTPRWPGFAIAAVLLAGTAFAIASRVRTPPATAAAPSESASAAESASASPVASAPIEAPVDSAPVIAASSKAHGAHTPKAGASSSAALASSAAAPSASTASAAAPASSASASPAASAPAASASAAPAAPPAAAYDPSRARVAIAAIHPLNTTIADVRKEMKDPIFSQCYSSALLGTAARPKDAHVTMHLETDDAGRVTDAELSGDKIPSTAGNCVMKAMMGKVIRPADGTGIASANVDLVFSPE